MWFNKLPKKIFAILLPIFSLILTRAVLALEVDLGRGGPPPEQGPAGYINYLFIFVLGLVAVLALAAMIYGGIKYILASGNVSKVDDAKDQIKQALIGLGIALFSYLILRTINPDLVKLKNPQLLRLQIEGADVPEFPANLPLGVDESGRRLGEPGSTAIIGRKGQAPDPNLQRQCQTLTDPNDPEGATSCVIRRIRNGETYCDCAGAFRGQGGF